MVFAAGLGTRMRSFRSDIPKPLVPVAGRTLIDRALDKLVQAGVQRAVVNVSHLGQMIIDHLASRHDIEIHFSVEDTPLETGGGIVKALPLLGDQPFFAINADISWVDGWTPALVRLAHAFDPETMDALLLACPTVRTTGYDGRGDFVINAGGQVRRRKGAEVSPFVFTGIQLIHPRVFAPYVGQATIPVFSLSSLMRFGCILGMARGWRRRKRF
jgi:MurNAc alpha-1-phosphate uridylyltransferase